ncbi:hypothetical protein GTW51_06130 [Aurantimonas aggregata]|uniref:DUF4145 domain-containing protein n=1 Tax=Aurantimonas aggregata TaxID=2047720 RepID=A0A6L9MEU8_9HYPH|nr:hypothetical protein [Aurantimonas aggregata]NDV86277.1 hypothetical protein [Aurantimonas aggregata]
MADTRDAWSAFLSPDVVRLKLISAGLFLIGHEMLVDSIQRHLRSFYADEWTKEGPIPGPEYETKVLALDPRGKKNPVRGSIAWLRQREAINSDDEAALRKVTDARNNIAHEMSSMVSAADMPDFLGEFQTMMSLLNKIERWWIVNVELPTDPDFCDKEIDEDGIVPGPAWIMHMLSQVALGEKDEAWELHRLFTEQWPSQNGR